MFSRTTAMETSIRVEEERIRAAYAKRIKNDLVYSCFNPGQLFLLQEVERRMLALLRKHGFSALNKVKILEIGCGTGYWLREFIKWGAKPEHMTGLDLLPDRIEQAKKSCPPATKLYCGNAERLAFADSTFDLVLQSTAFTSILDRGLKQRVAGEMLRVLRDDGLILWYDYFVNNPWNPDVRGVKKQEIKELFPACNTNLRRITLAPPIARWLAPRSWLMAHLLERFSPLCTHYIGAIRKAQAKLSYRIS